MPILRLAYTTQFLIALIAVFFLWSEIHGQGHLDLMPWRLKLGLAAGGAYAAVRATAAAVAHQPAWNIRTLKWFGAMLAPLVACGLVTYYDHLYGEEDDRQDAPSSSIADTIRRLSCVSRRADPLVRAGPPGPALPRRNESPANRSAGGAVL